jgi:hypothetical protein
MYVWVATWDVGSDGSGVDVFATRELAIDAAVDYANEMSLLGPDSMTEAEARVQLAAEGSIAFEAEGCCYGVEECEVRGYAG